MGLNSPSFPGGTAGQVGSLSDIEIDGTTLTADVTNNRIGIGTASPKTKLTVSGTVTLKEQASADADTAAYGQIWCKTATPNQLWFTNDAGTDTQLGAASGDITGVTAGTGLSGGGSSGGVTLNVEASQTQITAVGTIATGVWQGTAIAQAYIADDAISLAKMAGLARGKIIVGDSSGDPAALAAGSENEVLTTNGSGDAVWAAASGGAVDLNGLSAATVDVAADSIGVIDANDGNASRKESIADLATAMAGTGVTATNGVFSLNAVAAATGLAASNALPGGAASSSDQIIAIQVFS